MMPLQMVKLSSLSGLQLFQLLRYGALLLLGIGFAQLGMPPEVIATFETFMLFSGLLSFFWVSGLINTLMSLHHKAGEEDQSILLFQFFIALSGFGLVAALLFGALGSFLPSLMQVVRIGSFSVAQSAWLIGGYVALTAPIFLTEYVLYIQKLNKALVVYAIFSSSLTLILVALAAYSSGADGNLFSSLFIKALFAIAALKYVILSGILGKYAQFRLELKTLVRILGLAIPVILSILLSGSSEYIDGIIIKWKLTDFDFSIYRFGAKELPILLIMANTFSVAMVSVIASNVQEGITEIRHRSTRLMHVFFPLTILLMLVSLPLYKLVFTDVFADSAFIFNIYLLLIIPRLLFPQTILTGMLQTKYLFYSSTIEITVNVVLSLVLLHFIGLPGIALGTFMAACIDKCFLMYIAANKFAISPDTYVNFNWYTIYAVLTVLAFMIAHWVYFI
jgi:O-antigen/teichoic acid export membrane protein